MRIVLALSLLVAGAFGATPSPSYSAPHPGGGYQAPHGGGDPYFSQQDLAKLDDYLHSKHDPRGRSLLFNAQSTANVISGRHIYIKNIPKLLPRP